MNLKREAIAGVILCGGKSSRMGRPKWSLRIGEETFLERTLRVLEPVVGPRVVVAAADQQLPELPGDVAVVRDRVPEKGPLAGISGGLDALADMPDPPDAAYVTACDSPLLRPEFVCAIVDAIGDCDLAVPRDDCFYHPLAAIYRLSLAATARRLVEQGQLRPQFLIEAARSRIVDVEDLRRVDPRLDSLRNTNTPEDYAALLTAAGLPVPDWSAGGSE
jgi:molybdopterin-guanine dinucleotide biosynthesis protein A